MSNAQATISSIDNTIQRLLSTREALNNWIFHQNARLTVLGSLPIELFRRIFVFAVPGNDLVAGVLPALVLSQVSRHWRSIAHGIPSLWAKFEFSHPSQENTIGRPPISSQIVSENTVLRRLNMLLECTGDVRLSIIFHEPPEDKNRGLSINSPWERPTWKPVGVRLKDECYRWDRLTVPFGFLRFLAYPGYLREVTTFQVFGSQRELAAPIAWHQSNIATSLAEASHLQHLDLSSNLISRMCDLQPHIPWNRLRSFSGPIDFTPTNPKALAFDWTALEDLILLISSTRIPWVDNITIFKPVPRLKTLEIRLRDDGMDLSRANTAFGYFHCDTPSIEQLTLRGFEVESGSEHLFTLIQQNKDTLCRLFLDDTFVKDMDGLLEAAPSLTHLSFNHRALTTSNSQGVIERLRNLTQLRVLRYTAPFYFAIEQLPQLGLLDFVKERRPELNAECMLVASKRSTIHDTDSNSLKDAGFKVTVVFK